MIIKRRGFIAGLASLIAAPLVVRAESIMKISPQRYATVWGVDRFGNVVEHPLFDPISILDFGRSPAIEKFAEVTDWEYDFPVLPIVPKKWEFRDGAFERMAQIEPLQKIPTEGISAPFMLRDYTELKYQREE